MTHLPLETDDRTGALTRPTLTISYDSDADFLTALAPGEVIDGQMDDETDQLLSGLWVWRRGPGGPVIGFGVGDLSEWDVLGQDSTAEDLLWGPYLRFDAPTLGLVDASIGAIALAAQDMLHGSTPEVVFFDLAVSAHTDDELEEAEMFWRLSLAAGGMKALFGLGYTLLELGRPHEAFGHLRRYTEMTPRNAWAWLWRGRAAHAMGERDEAATCYRTAIVAEADGGFATDADERLAALEAGLPDTD